MRKVYLFLLMVFCVGFSWAEEGETAKNLTSAHCYSALNKADFDGRALAVTNLQLNRDVHQFTFANGTFYFFRPVHDQTVMALYIGTGQYQITPKNGDEKRVLGHIHGDLKTNAWSGDLTAVLLMFTDKTYTELTDGKSIAQKSDPAAVKEYDRFRKSQAEDFKVNFRMRLAQAMTNGGDDRKGLFLAFPKISKAPPLMVAVDPLGCDAIDFGYPRVSWEPSILYASDKKRGGYWYAQALKNEPLRSSPQRYVDAIHYEVDTEITGKENIKGKTILTFKPMVSDLHVMPIRLSGSLALGSVSLANAKGEPLKVSYLQSLDTAMFFDEPLVKGETYSLTLTYSGRKVLYDVGNGNYYVVQRTRWYPNVGVFGDRADFKLIFRIPKAEKLVATGKLVKEYEADGRKVSEWESDEPINVAGFNYGKFLQYDQTEPESGVSLSVHHQELVNENLIHNAMADGVNSVRLYSDYFGKLPYSTLAMTQQSQFGYGQAWPSLVFLPYVSFLTGTERQNFSRAANDLINNALAPHEVAHQWWGHQLTAATYRDQWLEEGFSEFSAGLLIQQTMGWQESNQFWKYAHEQIFAKIRGTKMRFFEVAPLNMGMRMDTHKTGGAYSTLTYSKGAFVLHMLRMMMMDTRNRQDPDEKFRTMMRNYYKTFQGKAVGTADFQKIVEKHMLPNMNATGDGGMDWFFNQWVHGRDIPEFESKITVKKEGDKYRLKGIVSQKSVPADFMVMMPVYIDFGKGHLVRFASIPFKGEMSQNPDWLLALPKKPKGVVINAYYDVLTRNDPAK